MSGNFVRLRGLIEKAEDHDKFIEEITQETLQQNDLDLLLRRVIEIKASNFKEKIQALIKKGANVNFYDSKDHISNVMMASQHCTFEFVEAVGRYKEVNFNHVDKRNVNVMCYALRNKSKQECVKILNYLLQKQPDLIKSVEGKKNLLLIAVERGKPEIVKVLLDHKADPNQICPDNGNTPLHEAVKGIRNKVTLHSKDIIKMLLMKGADCNLKNMQNKNAFENAEKGEEELRKIVQSIEEMKRENHQNQRKILEERQLSKNQSFSALPILKLNTPQQITKLFKQAQELSLKYGIPQMKNKLSLENKQESESEGSNSEFDQTEEESFLNQDQILSQLQIEIKSFQRECSRQYENTKPQVNTFLQKFRKILQNEHISVQVYGSYATGLWLKHCDIDLVLVPDKPFQMDTSSILDHVFNLLKKTSHISIKSIIINCKVRVPMIRVEIPIESNPSKSRKIDITVLDRSHNGPSIANFVNQQLRVHPLLKPMFFVVKSLTCKYKLTDPKKGGIRTYAIIIMLLSFIAKWNEHTLGKLLLDFLYYFGFYYEYFYDLAPDDSNDLSQEYDRREVMVLNILDPLNPMNNVGKKAKAFQLQNMFRTAYIVLHSNIQGKRLSFMLDTCKIIVDQ